MTEEKFEDLCLTDEQIKSAKAVYRAIRKAHKLGVCFWDNYGTLTCYNGKKITSPTPSPSDSRGDGYSLRDNDVSYYEILPNMAFQAGNADDELFFKEL